ncbi:MAG: histidine kinase [Polyangiaceae bacterium]|nr:histidine kinase [Polyangiaceae bacterium]
MQQPRLSAGRRWVVGMAIVTAVAAGQTAPAVMFGQPTSLVVLQLSFWLVVTPVQILVLSLAFDRTNRRGSSATRTLVESIALSAVIGACDLVALGWATERWLGIRLIPDRQLSEAALALVGAMVGTFICGIWALAFVLPYTAEQSRVRTAQAERLELEAAQLRSAAELARLRSQLEPHFLLNTLNTIAGLVTQDPREARRLIGCLGDLLRDSLRDQEEMQTLDAEVTWLRRYTEILSARHGEALRFDWDIQQNARSVFLPRLLLQPLVENAVKHGALRRGSGDGRVSVRAYLDGAETGSDQPLLLVCVVADNGPGLSTAPPREGAFGLRSVERRLKLKSPRANLKLESSSQGTRAIVTLPVARTHGPTTGSTHGPAEVA